MRCVSTGSLRCVAATCGTNATMEILADLTGKVVRGFGRGSKELGIPTANMDDNVVENLPENVQSGIYFGWAQVNEDEPEPMVMSVGWNPFYNNTKRSAEVHIIRQYDEDFYGADMRVRVLGFIRPEQNFDSLESLIAAINNDIRIAKEKLAAPEALELKKTPAFFIA
eukprot:m.50072 g.50072  ORF g.50072 m.50072 type:complete len:168 (+) comp6516_c0_seq1:1206-1709(+)